MTTVANAPAGAQLAQELEKLLHGHTVLLQTKLSTFADAAQVLDSSQKVLSTLQNAVGRGSQVLQSAANATALTLVEFCAQSVFVINKYPPTHPDDYFDKLVRDRFPNREAVLRPEAVRTEQLRKEAVCALELVDKLCDLPVSPDVLKKLQEWQPKFKAEREKRGAIATKRHYQSQGLDPDSANKKSPSKIWLVLIAGLGALYYFFR